ncbi:MAG: acyl-CoA thioesterase [Candidatus Cryptobacteroides sp.]|nr:acyl-CoA thioesterase [Rikenellaceae bacterium]MDY4562265.1 acyl-CoA thioesterase [Candidatus Cryptobacteroides sp.]
MSRELVVEKELEIRFSEVDMMGVVWHGNYPLYLEDAREAFGAEFGLSYALYIKENVFVPIVKMDVDYKRPVRFGMRPVIRIEYVPTDAAKVIFDYKLYDKESGDVFLTARTVQVFMDRDYKLMWFSPDFYTQWKQQMGLTE